MKANTKVLLYDILPKSAGDLSEWELFDASERYAYCRGCFGCWLKTPGRCVLTDKIERLGSLVMQADTLTIVSKCCYGGFSPSVKRMLDRCIPGVMPFFVTKRDSNGKREQHHTARYESRMALRVWFYGAFNDEEKELAKKLVEANGLNYWAKSVEVYFADTEEEITL